MIDRAPRGVLASLVEGTRAECEQRRRRRPGLAAEYLAMRPLASRFLSALEAETPAGFPRITQLKRASPSAGPMAPAASPASLAHSYMRAGARCISVLTEGRKFVGSLADLRELRAAVDPPLLPKDFIVGPYTILEAREAGADAVLLIAAAVEPDALVDLPDTAVVMGTRAGVEFVEPYEIDVLSGRAFPLVGVDARQLETLEVDPGRFEGLAPRLSAAGRLLVAESGVRSRSAIARAQDERAGAALGGEARMRSGVPEGLVRALQGAA